MSTPPVVVRPLRAPAHILEAFILSKETEGIIWRDARHHWSCLRTIARGDHDVNGPYSTLIAARKGCRAAFVAAENDKARTQTTTA